MLIKITPECYVNISEGPIELVEIDTQIREDPRVMIRFHGDGHGKTLPRECTIEEVVESINAGYREARWRKAAVNAQYNPGYRGDFSHPPYGAAPSPGFHHGGM